ncbi:hypothetical protein [Pararhodobacter sp.]|uniref:tyrosine-type recombinase/integrase n=1 Tax=Pararhodobacter sp. TaxID=2127056 RepID=UPI002AFEC5CA|nr:hypothetical protein [Pararhodobacter sp.]
MRRPHKVPLPNQALALLDDLRRLTGNGVYLFPSLRTHLRPMSENTLNGALRRLGYGGEEMTAHGFRATFTTLANESGLWCRFPRGSEPGFPSRSEPPLGYVSGFRLWSIRDCPPSFSAPRWLHWF